MNNRILFNLFLSLLLILFLLASSIAIKPPTPVSAASTIYVPDNYPTIQAAVNAASPGDTIIVKSGTYTENVDVNKSYLTIQSMNGAEVTIVQAANPNDNVFDVRANYICIKGLTIKDAGLFGSGIYIESGNHCLISDNRLLNNWCGIFTQFVEDCTITGNIANSNKNMGILLSSSVDNIINGNTATLNTNYGIYLSRSMNNEVASNILNSNGSGGVELDGSSGNNVKINVIQSHNYWGILLWDGSNNNTIMIVCSQRK